MCFSANASFTASVVLGVAGVLSVRTALKHHRAYLALSLMPLFFAIQQFFEGMVWLNLPNQTAIRPYALVYMFFAFSFWPVFFSFAILKTETRRKYIAIQRAILLFATIVGLFVYLPLFQADSFHVEVVKHHLAYVHYALNHKPLMMIISVTAYISCILMSGLISANRHIRYLSQMFLIAVAIANFADRMAFASVWCFLGAWLSLYVIYIVKRKAPAETLPLAQQS